MTRNGFSPSVIESLSLAQIRLFLSAIDKIDALQIAQNLHVTALGIGGNPKAIKERIKELTS